MLETKEIEISTRGQNDLVDITSLLRQIVASSKCRNGQVLIFVVGSTAGLTTIEFEPGLQRDFPRLLEKIAPAGDYYYHNETWHDGNGHSHLRASLIGSSLTIPFRDRELFLGTWQQAVLCEFDVKARKRRLVFQVSGE